MLSRERRLFFLAWLKNPIRVGVPVPSSKGLAKAMASQLKVEKDEYVVELGAGTGALTHGILRSGVSQNRLVIIERDPKFLAQLRGLFPEARVLQGDARNIKDLLRQHGIEQIAAVISGLPLLNMSHGVRHAIIHAAFSVLKPEGMFIQFTYGFMSPVPKYHQRDIGIRGKLAKRVWLNFPPAKVWRYEAEEAMA